MSSTVKTEVMTQGAPSFGHLMSQAVVCNGMIYTSGSLGIDPQTGEFAKGTVSDRVNQALKNLDNILKAAGSGLENAVKINIYISDIQYSSSVNEVYSKFFVQDIKPSRTCVVVKELGMGAEVEIEAVAHQ